MTEALIFGAVVACGWILIGIDLTLGKILKILESKKS